MPPDPNVPPKPQGENDPPKKPNEIDLDAILLPKKEAPPSGERINAGALLEQEQSAQLPKPPPQPPPPPPKERGIVQPLQTYKSDIENLIKDKNVSMINIAAAEAEKKRAQTETEKPTDHSEPSGIFVFLRKSLMIIGAAALLLTAIGLSIVVYIRLTATVDIVEEEPAPFIAVDKTTIVSVLQSQLTRSALMQGFEKARQASNVSLGLIERILPASTVVTLEDETSRLIPIELLLPIIASTVPDELVRTLDKDYLIGVHMFDGPQAFLIVRPDSYDHAFAAMLNWENTLKNELLPFFNRTPRPRPPVVSTATSTASSTPVVRTDFVDKIVENHDARVVLNESGDILLLWTFLDRNTLVITTNEYTLREIIARLRIPVTPSI